jgi:hypothetical protein
LEQDPGRITEEETEILLRSVQIGSLSRVAPSLYAYIAPQDATQHVDWSVLIPSSIPAFQGDVLSSLRSTPFAILQQALSSNDIVDVLNYRGERATYLKLLNPCAVVEYERTSGELSI